jgi:hypothetical protein
VRDPQKKPLEVDRGRPLNCFGTVISDKPGRRGVAGQEGMCLAWCILPILSVTGHGGVMYFALLLDNVVTENRSVLDGLRVAKGGLARE